MNRSHCITYHRKKQTKRALSHQVQRQRRFDMTLRPPIVDLRSRPSWLHKFFGSTPNTPEFDTVRWLNKRVGTSAGNIDHFTRSNDIESFTGEMDAAGISVG